VNAPDAFWPYRVACNLRHDHKSCARFRRYACMFLLGVPRMKNKTIAGEWRAALSLLGCRHRTALSAAARAWPGSFGVSLAGAWYNRASAQRNIEGFI